MSSINDETLSESTTPSFEFKYVDIGNVDSIKGIIQHAIRQYKKDRDPRAPLFRFKKRALVHFAVDPDQVHMTTRLQKEKTVFLPFNRGSYPGEIKCGKGNPPHPSGYRTGYLWEEVLSRDSFLDILAGFMFIEHSERKVDDSKGGRKTIKRETLIFPRYHQLDSVRKLVDTSRQEGAGNNYLIQHSAGSGKTNSISWLGHHLASLHDENDRKIYDCVVVISDRQVIDRQLQDAIYQIDHAQGVVRPIDEDSKQLANALIDGTKIVVTTLQKFPFVLRALLMNLSEGKFESLSPEEQKQVQEEADSYRAKIADRQYAVIVDEAHSSQTGETARELKEILGAGMDHDEEDDIDLENRLNLIMEPRGRQKNLSFYAFTATPKGKSLELFGRPGTSGKPEAFHTYSMRQAIEEGFIKDVQTLSRLNRTYPGKDHPFVLDFVNDREDIYASFKPYFDATSLQEVSDPQQLEEIKHEMDQMQVYHWSEVDAFAEIFYKLAAKHQRQDHARMEQQLQPAVDRFKGLEEDQRQLFRDKLRGYVNIYSFLSQIMPWNDPDHEKLYSFGRFLLPHLPTGREVHIISPEDDVALRYYRLERVASDPINLDEGEDVQVKSPTDVGSGKATDKEAPLSSIIEVLNERFGTDFTEEDRLFFEQIKEHASQDEQVIHTAKANPLDKFELGIKDMLESMMIQRMSKNDEIVTRYMDDKEFQQVVFSHMVKDIFEKVLEREMEE